MPRFKSPYYPFSWLVPPARIYGAREAHARIMSVPAAGRQTILMIEPQCWDLEHASFNAALLASVLSAYPEDEVVFMGEECHLANVRKAITKHAPRDVGRVQWRAIPIIAREATGWLRFFAERRDLARVLAEAE